MVSKTPRFEYKVHRPFSSLRFLVGTQESEVTKSSSGPRTLGEEPPRFLDPGKEVGHEGPYPSRDF